MPTILVDPGDPFAPVGTKRWCIAIHQDACRQKRDGQFAVHCLKYTLRTLHDGEHYKQLSDINERPFASWEDFVQYREPFGLGMRLEVATAVMQEPDETRLLSDVMAGVEPLGKHGGERSGKQGAYGTLPRGANSAAYLAARLQRDAPEIAARIDEYPSMRAAAKAAGIPVQPAGISRPATMAKRIVAQGNEYALAVIAEIQAQLTDGGAG